MPDFNTRRPQEPNEPNRLGISLLADKLRALLITSKHRIPLIANRSRSLLIASQQRVVLIADRLRGLLVAHRLRTLLISGGILLLVVAAIPIGLLIYSSGGMGNQQQEASKEGGIIPGIQRRFMESIRVDPDLSRKIVFQLNRTGSSGSEIWTMNASGSGLQQLTDSADYSSDLPARSPDLRKIAFTRWVTKEVIEDESASASARSAGPSAINVPYVFVMNADGSDEHKLMDTVGAYPNWSPDGKMIVFSSNCDLYVATADGSGTPRRLTTAPGCESNPAWSPDGTQIAFTSDRGGNLDIYVINACCEEDSTNQAQQLTDDPLDDTDPAWSPDGKEIAFTHSWPLTDSSNPDIYKMDADGSGKTRLTYSDAIEAQPTWSPHGEKIAFTRQHLPAVSGAIYETSGIFTMDADGTDPAPIRVFDFNARALFFPEWGGTAQQDEGAEQAIEDEPTEQAIAGWRALDARLSDVAVQAYIERMNGLLREKNLRDPAGWQALRTRLGDEFVSSHTVSLFQTVDRSHKEELLRFLIEADLIREVDGRAPLISLLGVDLKGIDLSNADLSDTHLGGVRLSGADLSGADLSGADVDGGDWTGADLSGADLSGANLRADLSSANLSGANLNGANLSWADLRGIKGVSKQELELLRQDGRLDSAIMPDGLQHPPCTLESSVPCSENTAQGRTTP